MVDENKKWQNFFGIIFAGIGSAVGLMNIWRFPYIVGENGGAAFLLVYIACLTFIGLPLLMSELFLGKHTASDPCNAYKKLGGKRWSNVGKGILILGFVICGFYSVIAGRILGYWIEAIKGSFSFSSTQDSVNLYQSLESSLSWNIICHGLFTIICSRIVYKGISKGIERGNKIMMPILFVMLLVLAVKSILAKNANEGLEFLLNPQWSMLSPKSIMIALGHACFTLSIGQGTMIVYGSYMSKADNVPIASTTIAIFDTIISLMVACVLFMITFSVGLKPNAGPGLLFHTLPYVFAKMQGGYFIGIAFFFIVLLAAISSEISAMEPCIAYLVEKFSLNRKLVTVAIGCGTFLLGTFFAYSNDILYSVAEIVSDIFLPLSALVTILFVGWKMNGNDLFESKKNSLLYKMKNMYFCIFFKIVTPTAILLVFAWNFFSH